MRAPLRLPRNLLVTLFDAFPFCLEDALGQGHEILNGSLPLRCSRVVRYNGVRNIPKPLDRSQEFLVVFLVWVKRKVNLGNEDLGLPCFFLNLRRHREIVFMCGPQFAYVGTVGPDGCEIVTQCVVVTH